MKYLNYLLLPLLVLFGCSSANSGTNDVKDRLVDFIIVADPALDYVEQYVVKPEDAEKVQKVRDLLALLAASDPIELSSVEDLEAALDEVLTMYRTYQVDFNSKDPETIDREVLGIRTAFNLLKVLVK